MAPRLALVATGSDQKQRLYVRLIDQLQATVLSGTENARDPFFSPDGQWIGFFADGKLKKISVAGGPAVMLCDAANDRGGSWGVKMAPLCSNRTTWRRYPKFPQREERLNRWLRSTRKLAKPRKGGPRR